MLVFENSPIRLIISLRSIEKVFFNNQIEEIKSYSFNKDILFIVAKRCRATAWDAEEGSTLFDTTEYRVLKIQKALSATR